MIDYRYCSVIKSRTEMGLNLSEKIQKIRLIEKRRFRDRGLGNTVLGTALLFVFFWVVRQIGKYFWPETIPNKNAFVAWGSVIIHTLFGVIGIIYALPGYLGWFSFYKNFQVNNKSKWPWQRQNWDEVKAKTIRNLFINQFLIYPIPCYLSTLIGIQLRFDQFPSFWQVFLQTNMIFFMEDFFFYWCHRAAHQVKSFYVYHKVHHEYDHLYTPASEYHHPLDYIFANILPSAVCFILLGNRVHAFTFLFWIVHKIAFSGQNHCGYEFPWSPFRTLPFVAEVSYHDNHHSENIGNYAGSWYIWDVFFDTCGPSVEKYIKGIKKE